MKVSSFLCRQSCLSAYLPHGIQLRYSEVMEGRVNPQGVEREKQEAGTTKAGCVLFCHWKVGNRSQIGCQICVPTAHAQLFNTHVVHHLLHLNVPQERSVL